MNENLGIVIEGMEAWTRRILESKALKNRADQETGNSTGLVTPRASLESTCIVTPVSPFLTPFTPTAALPSASTTQSTHPYTVYQSETGKVSVTYGTHGDYEPNIGGDLLSNIPPPTLTVPSGTSYVYVIIETDADGATDADHITIDIYTSEQVDDDPNLDGTDGTFYQKLARLDRSGDTIIVFPNVLGSQDFKYCTSMTFGLV